MRPLLPSPRLQGLAHAAVGLLCAGLAMSFTVVPAEALADQAIAMLAALGAYHLLQAARVRVAEMLDGLEEHIGRERGHRPSGTGPKPRPPRGGSGARGGR